jgi:tRNA dimethylallyltransferase
VDKQKRLIVLVGPTAVGKTPVAIQLAHQLETVIISADSRQIYKELEIGTAKPTPAELATVPHYFIDIKSISEDYDAGQYGREALMMIHEFFKKYDNLILCGGSGLYVRAVTDGFDEMPEVAEGVREEIIKGFEEKGLAWLQGQVEASDPDYFSVVDQKNPQRLMRALELNYSAGKTVTELRRKEKINHSFKIVKIGLELERDTLYQRIDDRIDVMVQAGLFDEANFFYSQRNLQALQTVGYREIFGYLDGLYDKEEAIRLLKRNSRRYAKRQLTWFKKDKEVKWFMPNQITDIMEVIRNSKFEIE